MADDDWYRNSEWNEEIAATFEAKLRRARRKEQYIRIQASYLAKKYPEVALRLLDRFLAMPDQWEQAAAHFARAEAFCSLNRLDDAARAYEDALNRESEFPRLETTAWIELPFMIAVEKMESRYAQALALLDQHKSRIMFAVDGFKWHAAKALILNAKRDRAEAAREASQAREFASRDSSGFRYHPRAGLVEPTYDQLKTMLETLSNAT
jgi:hypothetical protein